MDKLSQASEDLLNNKTKNKVSNLFKALADPTRISILYALKHNRLTVSELTIVLNMTQSAVSHQLRTLRDANLVSFEKKGKEVYYSLADDHVHQIFDQAVEHVEE